MVNMFIPTDYPTYYWNNLKKGTYVFRFSNLNDAIILNIKSRYDYFKYTVEYIESNIGFYGLEKRQKMYLILPLKGFTIALNIYKDRKILNKIKSNDSLVVTIYKKNKKILRILDIWIEKKKEKEDNHNIIEEEQIL